MLKIRLKPLQVESKGPLSVAWWLQFAIARLFVDEVTDYRKILQYVKCTLWHHTSTTFHMLPNLPYLVATCFGCPASAQQHWSNLGSAAQQVGSECPHALLNVCPDLLVLLQASQLQPAAVLEEDDHVTPQAKGAWRGADLLDLAVSHLGLLGQRRGGMHTTGQQAGHF